MTNINFSASFLFSSWFNTSFFFPLINSTTQQQNSPFCSSALDSCFFYSVIYFPSLFPPDSSCCQLSFSTLCNMNSAGFFTSSFRPWSETDTFPDTLPLPVKFQFPHSPLFWLCWAVIHPALLNIKGNLLCDSCSSRLAVTREIYGLENSSCIVAFCCRKADQAANSVLVWRTTWSSEAWLNCLCF